MSKAVMKRVLEALVRVNASPHLQDLHHAFDEEINALHQALAEPSPLEDVLVYGSAWSKDGKRIDPMSVYKEPEQEPVAWMCPDDPDRRTAFSWPGTDRHSDFTVPLYTAPTPHREHITDGSPCWCNPDVIEEEGGNVIVHNYEDNWQQYAKPGETAQRCIERHRAEQDALMKLYATPRKPLTDEEIDHICKSFSLGFTDREIARAIERAHGITGETK